MLFKMAVSTAHQASVVLSDLLFILLIALHLTWLLTLLRVDLVAHPPFLLADSTLRSAPSHATG
jgi:hypothetical protein